MFELTADGLDRTISVLLLVAAMLVIAAVRLALAAVLRDIPAARDEDDQRGGVSGMVWIVLALAAVTGACADGQAVPVAGPEMPAVAASDGSATSTTQSTRDDPQSHNDMPSAPVADLVLNPDRSGNVLVKGRPPTDKATLTGYQVITWRDDPEKPGTYLLDRKVWRITVIDQDTIGAFTEGGSYKGEVRPVYLNRILGPAAVAFFSIDAVTSSPSSGPSGQCAVIPTAAPCVREG